MTRHRRHVRFSLAFGAFGVVAALYGTGGELLDLSSHPPLSVLAGWGALVGGTIGWIAASLPRRATFPLGVATILAAGGFLAGLAVAVHLLGQDLIDGNGNSQLATSLAGAGVGWFLGMLIGVAIAAEARSFTSREAWLLRGVGAAALAIGAWIARLMATSVGEPWLATKRYLEPAQLAVAADAVLVCITLLVVAGGRHRSEVDAVDGIAEGSLWTRGVTGAGVVLGCLVLVAVLATLPASSALHEDRRHAYVNDLALSRLNGAARRYMEVRGTYPSDLATLTAGRPVGPESVVTVFLVTPDKLCLTIGTDLGSGEGVGPFESSALRPRSESTWAGEMDGHCGADT
jgi:hypothetical protein